MHGAPVQGPPKDEGRGPRQGIRVQQVTPFQPHEHRLRVADLRQKRLRGYFV